MAKIVNITEQLNFEENPKLQIKDKEVKVNADATTVLQLMQIIGNQDQKEADFSAQTIITMYDLVFPEASRAALSDLKLSFKDLTVVIQAAMSLIMGDVEQGE